MWALILKYVEPILSWLILLAVAGWVIYAGLIRPVINPTPTTTQTGGTSFNYDIKIGALSCARIPDPVKILAEKSNVITNKAGN